MPKAARPSLTTEGVAGLILNAGQDDDAMSGRGRSFRIGHFAPAEALGKIAGEFLAPAAHMFRAGMDAFGGSGVGIVDPPVGVLCRRAAGSLDRRRHGGESPRLPVQRGEIAADLIRPHLRVAWRKAEMQPISLTPRGGFNSAIERLWRCGAWSCRAEWAGRIR